MTSTAVMVKQWKERNAHRLVQCRWACTLTRNACRLYQVRSRRYVFHFAGDHHPPPRPNAEYVRCLLPEPCPHAISDDESREIRAELKLAGDLFPFRRRDPGVRQVDERLVSPDEMLQEADWKRSLIKRREE
ncbi:MAG: hypothetical protein LDL33_11815 [Desulfomonile sp.]|nr:hypothetical protein [Desulfomonile sp.]